MSATVPSHLSHPKYRRDIDGLRAVAVLSVLAFHGFPRALTGGFVGVDVFFVISGFLISSILFENFESDRFSYVEFYSRRIRRIFPALVTVLVLSYLVGWFLLFAEEFKSLGKHTAGGAGFVANLFLYMERGYFDSSAEAKPLLHLWSLGVEEQFYIFWPLLLGLVWKRRINFLGVTLAIALASFAYNLYMVGRDADAAFYSPLTRFWEHMRGGMLAYWSMHRPTAQAPAGNWRSALGLILIAGSVLLLSKNNVFPGVWALFPTLGAFLIMSAAPTAWVNRYILGHPVMVWVGVISYPLYLWHWPLLAFARIDEGHPTGTVVRLMALASSFPFAWLTYLLIENPIRRSRSPRPVVALAVSMGLVFCIGALTFVKGGFEFRAAARNFPVTPVSEFTASRTSDGSCERLFHKNSVKEEVCLANDPQPQILVVGDSHAMALNAAAYLREVPLKTVLVAGVACPPYPQVAFTPLAATNFGNNCAAIVADELRMAAAIPSITTVIVAAHFGDLGRFSYADTQGHPLSVGQAFLLGNETLIGQLQALRKRVIYIIDVPALKIAPQNCVPRLFKPDPPSCNLPEPVALEEQKQYRAWVAELARTAPSVSFYDAFSALCDTRTCRARDQDSFFYQDYDHLSVRGSLLVLDDLRRADHL
jgi:peptidoglycan/LPS O-acetylase OafA/YrhL